MKADREPEMLPEYDFSAGRRGRSAQRYAEGTNIVLLDPDLAAQFSDSKHVNEALRAWLKLNPRVDGEPPTERSLPS